MVKLSKSPVIFKEKPHEYWLGHRQLGGITQVVHWIYPKTYEGISQKKLDDAAARGTRIHHLCQEYDEEGLLSDEPQVQDYIYLTADMEHVASEYIVTDGLDYASGIDKIYEGTNNGVILGDIKCTSELIEQNVTLQLSIYAMLFEKMNPNVPVEKLIAIWLPLEKYGKAKIVECTRIPSALCEEILDCFLNCPWEDDTMREKIAASTMPVMDEKSLAVMRNKEQEIARIERQIAILKEESEKNRAVILKIMQYANYKVWEGKELIITRKLGSTRKTLDSKKVKEKYPDVYDDCLKESQTAESLLIRTK